jgi:tetratricopeptide (TPR) repeat protein
VSSAAPDDAKGKLLLVEALSSLGRQESLSGQTQSGRRHLDECSRMLEKVVVENPEGLELAVKLNILLGGLARHEGEYLRALTEWRRAAKMVENLRSVSPVEKAEHWESIVKGQLAFALSQTGDLKEADRMLDEAIKTAELLAARLPQNAYEARQVWVNRQARALFAGSPRFVNEGDLATSLELYREAERQHRQEFETDKANIRWYVDFITADFGVALVTSEMSPAKGLPLLQENLRLCLSVSPEQLETQVSNFSVATVYHSAARAAARLQRWGLARDYLSKALPVQESLMKRTPYFRTRLDHADLLKEIAGVEAGAGNRALAENKYREALKELQDLADHSKEIFWVWKTTEALEGLGDVRRTVDHTEACALYTRSLEAWNRWKSEGGQDSSFFRIRRDRAAARVVLCKD